MNVKQRINNGELIFSPAIVTPPSPQSASRQARCFTLRMNPQKDHDRPKSTSPHSTKRVTLCKPVD